MTPAAKLRRTLKRKVEALGGELRLYVSPGKKGVADCLCFMPGGIKLLAEIKAGDDEESRAQIKERKKMIELGHYIWIIREEKDMDEMLNFGPLYRGEKAE